MNSQAHPDDSFETMLRERIHQLADHAPVAVRQPDEARVAVFEGPRRRRRIAGIGATIVVLAGGAGLTAIGFQGASQPGGADSPEAAVQEFADALAAEDLLGMIDVTLPEEVGALRVAFDDAMREAKRLDLLDESFALDHVAGVDVVIDGLELTTEALAPDLVAVSPSAGSWSATFDQSAFAFGDSLRGSDLLASGSGTGGSLIDSQARLVTVERDGKWFVSLGMSVAEAIRVNAGAEPPSSLGVLTEGSPTPEAAVDEFYRRLAALDVSGTAGLMAPGEGEAFRRYASLWFPVVDEWAANAAAAGLHLDLSGLEYERFGDGSRLSLRPTAFVLEGTVPAAWFGSSNGSQGNPRIAGQPVVVFTYDGAGAWVLAADAALPATTAELGEPLRYDDPNLVAVLEGSQNYSTTYATPDGTIEPFSEDVPAPPEAPLPIRIERRDGCTTMTGQPFLDMFHPAAAERIDDQTVRLCSGESDSVMSLFLIAVVGSQGFPTLPTVAVVEDHGEWFVSPIGTIAAQLTQGFRDVPDGANVIDMPLVPYLLQAAPRATIDAMLTGENGAPIPAECVYIVEPIEAGATRIIADPPLDQVQACAAVLMYGSSGGYSEGGAVRVEAPARAPVPESVPVPASMPATTAP